MGSRKMWIKVTVISCKSATTEEEEEEEFDNNDKEEEEDKDGQPQNVNLGDR